MDELDRKYKDFWPKLDQFIRRSGMEPIFDTPREIMEETEWVYYKARALLGTADGDELVLHIASCEEYCRTYAFAAYEMGRCEGSSTQTQGKGVPFP